MNEQKLKTTLQSLLNKGIVYCTLELMDGKLVEVYRLLPQPKNVKFLCADCETPLTRNKYCPICEAEELFRK